MPTKKNDPAAKKDRQISALKDEVFTLSVKAQTLASTLGIREAELRNARQAMERIGGEEVALGRVGTVEDLSEKLADRDRTIEQLQTEVSDAVRGLHASRKEQETSDRALVVALEQLQTEQQAHNATATARHEAEALLVATRRELHAATDTLAAARERHARELAAADPKELGRRLQRERDEHKATKRLLAEAQGRLVAIEGQSASQRLLPEFAYAQGLRLKGLRQRAAQRAQAEQRPAAP